MIIGFGSTEKETAIKIIRECSEAMKANGAQGIEDVQKKYAEEDKRFGEMSRDEAPERYSYFWAIRYDIYEGKFMVEFTFHHIYRSIFSDDGWALLKTRWILSVDPNNGEAIYREA